MSNKCEEFTKEGAELFNKIQLELDKVIERNAVNERGMLESEKSDIATVALSCTTANILALHACCKTHLMLNVGEFCQALMNEALRLYDAENGANATKH